MGKSVIASSIVGKCAEYENTAVLYFFFRQIIEANRYPRSLVIDWLSQLLPKSPLLTEILSETIQDHPDISNVSLDSLWSILVDTLKSCPRVYCVADALDEMDPAQIGFLDKLAELGQENSDKVKIFVTSRQSDEIERQLKDCLSIKLKLNRHRVDNDIDLYIRNRLSLLPKESLTVEAQHEIEERVRAMSNGVFLYARLMLDQLLQRLPKTLTQLDEELGRSPLVLDDLYSSILREHRVRSGGTEEDQMLILQWVIHAIRPLRLLEIADIVSLRAALKGIELPRKDAKALVRSVCGPLLDIMGDETVQIFHHSLTEFLIDESRQIKPGCFPILRPVEAHKAIALTSIAYLSLDCFSEDWPGHAKQTSKMPSGLIDQGPTRQDNNDAWRERSHGYPLLNYVAYNWPRHVVKSSQDDLGLFTRLDKFLNPDSFTFSNWLKFFWHPLSNFSRNNTAPQNFGPIFVAAYFSMTNYLQYLLKQSQYYDEEDDSHRRTPLSYAAENGHDDVVELLLQFGANHTQFSCYGKAPIHYGAEKGHHLVITALIAAGADPFTSLKPADHSVASYVQPLHMRNNPLELAIEGHHYKAVVVLAKFEYNWPVSRQNSILKIAIDSGDPNMVKILICTAKMDVRALSSLLLLRATFQIEAVVRVLLENGADPNGVGPASSVLGHGARENTNITALHVCALNRYQTARVSYETCETLLKHGANIDALSSDGRTSLMFASAGNLGLVQWLLRNGASVNMKDITGSTALHYADSDEIVVALLQGGADANARDDKGRTALMRHRFVSRKLIEAGIDINAQDNKGNSVLWHYSDPDRLPALIGLGVDPNIRNNKGITALIYYAGKNPELSLDTNVLVDLINTGADINVQDQQGTTALHFLSIECIDHAIAHILGRSPDLSLKDRQGNSIIHAACAHLSIASRRGVANNISMLTQLKEPTIKKLLDAGCDVRAINLDGDTPLHKAAASNYPAGPVFRLLKEAGADISTRNNAGLTALHYAATNVSTHSLVQDWGDPSSNWYQHSERNLVSLLQTYSNVPVNLNTQTVEGSTPFHLASSTSEYHAYSLLVAGADVYAKCWQRRTSLHYAARARKSSVIGLILKKIATNDKMKIAAFINARDRSGRTALMDAARAGLYDAVKWLLEAGADHRVVDKTGRNALHAAAEIGEEHQLMSLLDPVGVAVIDRTQIKDSSRPKSILEWQNHGRSRLPVATINHMEPWRPLEVVKLLLDAGIDQFMRDKNGLYPAHVAATSKSQHVFQRLIVGREPMFPFRDEDLEGFKAKDGFGILPRLWFKQDPALMLHALQLAANARLSKPYLSYLPLAGLTETWLLSEAARHGDIDLVCELQSKGLSLTALDDGTTPLHQASKFGWFSIVSLAKSDVDTLDSNGLTPLMLACKSPYSNSRTIEVLVLNGADVNAKMNYTGWNGYGREFYYTDLSAIHYLAAGDYFWQLSAIEVLLSAGANPNQLATPLGSALHVAAHRSYGRRHPLLPHGHRGFWKNEMLQILLRWSADLMVQNADGYTPAALAGDDTQALKILLLHGAERPSIIPAAKSRNIDALRILVDPQQGLKPEEKDCLWEIIPAFLDTPFELVREVLDFLLENGASISAENRKPLVHIIISGDQVDFLTFFISRGLDLNAVDNIGRTALMISVTQGVDPMYADLLVAGSNVTIVDNKGKSVLHYFLDTPSNYWIESLLPKFLDAGAPTNTRDHYGNLPINLALRFLYISAVRHFLDRGLDVLSPDPNGDGPLHLLMRALTNHKLEEQVRPLILRLVKEVGADINARNIQGRTPIFSYISTPRRKISGMELLQELGANIFVVDNDGTNLCMAFAQAYEYVEHRQSELSVFEWLVEQGVDPLADNGEGKNALDVASAKDLMNLLDLFREK